MPRLRLPTHLRCKDAGAVILILLGLAGMLHHFSANPESPAVPAPKATASTFIAPALPRRSSIAGTSRPSEAVQAMRRRLRAFVIPWPNIKSVPVSDALALLQHHWQTLPHETDAIHPATFILSEAATHHLAAAQPPVHVCLEIPGIALLTQLQLLAAQTELHLRIVETGAILEIPTHRPNSRMPTKSVPLDILTMHRFTSRSLRIFHEQAETLDESGRRESFLTDPRGVQVSLRLLKKSAPDSTPEEGGVAASVSDDGFINYGAPIQATAINALGLSEPVILTDSRITQPVFSTRMQNHQQKQALAKLFAAMGISEDLSLAEDNYQPAMGGHFWNADDSVLTASGPQRTLRIAAETAAAIFESASAGASLEFAIADWENNQPPSEPYSDSKKARRPPTSPSTKDSSAPLPSWTYLKTKCGVPMAGSLPPLWSNPDFLLPPPNSTARVVVEKTGARFLLDLTLELPGRPDILFTDAAKPVLKAHTLPRELVRSNQWHRVDLPHSSGGSTAQRQSLFVRINHAVMETK